MLRFESKFKIYEFMKNFRKALQATLFSCLAVACDPGVRPERDPGENTGDSQVFMTAADMGADIGTILQPEADAFVEVDMIDVVDSDNDGVIDIEDNCSNNFNPNQADSDYDGIGNICDLDVDGDGVINTRDNCETIHNADQVDLDLDGNGDACDDDLDGDGIVNSVDNCVLVVNSGQFDLDQDLIGDACDTDIDGDGVKNEADNCVRVPNADQTDTDLNGVGDACEDDLDGDGFADANDNCPAVRNGAQADDDMDGIGNACDLDADNDGVNDALDNCPLVSNADQTDVDTDGLGDACDNLIDSDDDGIEDTLDNCPEIANVDQADFDSDNIGDPCDNDNDNDGVFDSDDNCPRTINPDQSDIDVDGLGDVCDEDMDNDGHLNIDDNCSDVANRFQEDFDNDGLGDACEDCSDARVVLESVPSVTTVLARRFGHIDTHLDGMFGFVRYRVSEIVSECNVVPDPIQFADTMRVLNPQMPIESVEFMDNQLVNGSPYLTVGGFIEINLGEVTQSPFIDQDLDGQVDVIRLPETVVSWLGNNVQIELGSMVDRVIFYPFGLSFSFSYPLEPIVHSDGLEFDRMIRLASAISNENFLTDNELAVAANVFRTEFHDFDYSSERPLLSDLIGAVPVDYNYYRNIANGMCVTYWDALTVAQELDWFHAFMPGDEYVSQRQDLPSRISTHSLVPNFTRFPNNDVDCQIVFPHLNVLDANGNVISVPSANTNYPFGFSILFRD